MIIRHEDDTDVWNDPSYLHREDYWVFDKLILSKKLEYCCGPKGIDVPCPGEYIIRPCVNVLGMGRGAEIVWIDEGTESIPDGFFWCEVFKGRHLSIDYKDGEQILCVEGTKACDGDPLWKWKRWKRLDDVFVPFPHFIIDDLKGSYKYINIEMIDDRIIEIHLRSNPDFPIGEGYTEVIPVFDGDDISDRRITEMNKKGYNYIENEYHDFMRIGFFYRK